jgi:predicted small secreted protein
MTRSRVAILLIGLSSIVLSACSTIRGYPEDPEDTDATLKALAPYFAVNSEDKYNGTTDATVKRQLRDDIVMHRMRAYQLEFDQFEKALNTYGNTITTGSDLVALTLSGLAATTGNASTKAALAAASGGIIGAQGDINKDLFFQKTMPALLAQMEANRAKAKLAIFAGLAQDDGKYSLARADEDLDTLKMAGSIPGAISTITQQAGNANDTAKSQLQELSNVKYGGALPSSTRIKAWLYPGGKEVDSQGKLVAPLPVNLKALQNWMSADKIDANLTQIPLEVLVDGDTPQLEADRQRALSDLKIP